MSPTFVVSMTVRSMPSSSLCRLLREVRSELVLRHPSWLSIVMHIRNSSISVNLRSWKPSTSTSTGLQPPVCWFVKSLSVLTKLSHIPCGAACARKTFACRRSVLPCLTKILFGFHTYDKVTPRTPSFGVPCSVDPLLFAPPAAAFSHFHTSNAELVVFLEVCLVAPFPCSLPYTIDALRSLPTASHCPFARAEALPRMVYSAFATSSSKCFAHPFLMVNRSRILLVKPPDPKAAHNAPRDCIAHSLQRLNVGGTPVSSVPMATST